MTEKLSLFNVDKRLRAAEAKQAAQQRVMSATVVCVVIMAVSLCEIYATLLAGITVR